MNNANFNFKIASFNVRGINDQKKRLSIFRSLKQKKLDICLLQETYGTSQIENMWRNQWGGNILFSNGTNHARGVALLVRAGFDANITNVITDNIGRMMLVDINIQGTPFKILNLYAPNTELGQYHFSRYIKNNLNTNVNPHEKLIIGGDFNIILDTNLDRKGGTMQFSRKHDEIVDNLEDIMNYFELNDIWRVRNPTTKRFTWRQKTPPIYSRLDRWLISDILSDTVEETDILPGVRSDHSIITLHLSSSKNTHQGKGFWKLNNSFLNEDKYIRGITENVKQWELDSHGMNARMKWEFTKYKVKQFSIKYGKEKAAYVQNTERELENKLKKLEEQLDENSFQSTDNLNREINETRARLEEIANYKTEGLILRSRCQWHEKGEKSNKYFLRLENRNKARKTMNKLQRENGTFTTDPKEILQMQAEFYQTLYSQNEHKTDEEIKTYLDHIATPKLNQADKDSCEGELTIHECSAVLKTFNNGKTPGNDGLTIEFLKKI